MSPGLLAQVACILEVTARKPGNVHRRADFEGDAHYLDFLLSAAAIAGPMDRAVERGVGPTVLAAVEATRQLVANNTNLGLILLLGPLASVPESVPLRAGVGDVLARTTVDDARSVYRAIRLARPGGLGKVDHEDIADEPTISLVEAMRLALARDLIARQYINGYADVFDLVLPALTRSVGAGGGLETAIVTAFVTTLAAIPDTLIARKRGETIAAEASRRASAALSNGDFEALDLWLRSDGHTLNPGATADLIAAALFVSLRDGTIVLPTRVGTWDA